MVISNVATRVVEVVVDKWLNIELSDSTGVSALVISNVATRVVVEVVVDKWLNCVDFIDGL